MKAQIILVLLLVGLLSTKGFANNTEPKQEAKKTSKAKYDFNIFKLLSITTGQEMADSLKINPADLPIKRKDD